MASTCNSCGSERLENFYEVDGIPCHSVLQMPTREKAISYPRGNLKLAFCQACGFIQNSVFDGSVHEYSQQYEETQGFSPTFNAFARELAQRWIDRYELHGKHVLEIGCGKGEFLSLLCDLGPNDGVGLDPAYVPERNKSESATRVEFIQDFYGEKYAHLTADFVCCRHTLEHIQPTMEFMRTVRRSIGERQETVVAFELPDIERVLKEQAFWDIYYEHCSYFSLGSLSRLFRSSGFEVLDLAKDFGGQYLLIDARIATGTNGSSTAHRVPEGEESVEALAADVAKFKDEVQHKMQSWKDILRDNHGRGRRAVLWGSGSKAVAFLTTLGIGEEVGHVTDINPHRHGMFMPGTGHEIIPPAELKNYKPDLVVVMNPVYVEEISADLQKMGLNPEVIAV